MLALLALLILSAAAILVLRARDARRFVLGVLGAAVLWLLLWYPNIAALPLPSGLAPLYQGLLPTWSWDFQFAVNTDPAFDSALVDSGTLDRRGHGGAGGRRRRAGGPLVGWDRDGSVPGLARRCRTGLGTAPGAAAEAEAAEGQTAPSPAICPLG